MKNKILKKNTEQAQHHFFNKKSGAGQAMIIGVLFLMFASITLIYGVSTPLLSEIRGFGGLKNSNNSFFAAESILEDAVLRLKNSQPMPSSTNLALNGASASATVSDISGGKEVNVAGDSNNRIRKIKTTLSLGDGVAFHYGVQTGNGGFIMGSNAGVYGNVYSNGNITGSNGSFVTGSAIAANSAALSADQSNVLPTPPTSGIIFGQTSAAQDAAQRFSVSSTGPVNKVRLNLRKISTPGNLTLRITDDSAGAPGSTIVSATLSASLVTTSYGFVEVVFATNPDLSAGTTYWLVLDGTNNSTRYYEWATNNAYSSGELKTGRVGSTWSNVSPAADGYFEIYLGGLMALIDNIDVGQNGIGDAHAHTVNNSSVAANLYCQTGTGNNKSCDTSQSDPSPQAFPVSEANVASWKTDAEAGGVINGNYTVDSATATLGPKKINGNLLITNNATLRITGTIWVTGTITTTNNVTLELDPSYGEAGGIIISDSYIVLSNNVVAQGSGAPNSHLLLISTSNCSGGGTCGGNYAVDLSNNVDGVVFNAQYGTIHVSNNVGLNAATAHTILMDNNATVTYESGLSNLSFSSGPSGGYEINFWGEVE